MMSNYSHSQKCHLLHAFEHLRDYPPEYPSIGICGNLDAVLEKLYYKEKTAAFVYRFMCDIVKDWPETYVHRGNIIDLEYPISGIKEYCLSHREKSMFDKSTEHGLKRYRLIDYCIQRLKDELSS
jgi:hypothetical protein